MNAVAVFDLQNTVQAPAAEPEPTAEETEEQAAEKKESSRFAYATLVSEPQKAAAAAAPPARGKDGHLTIGGKSGAQVLANAPVIKA